MSRFWFFGGGGKVFIATAACSLGAAKQLALDYNRQPGSLGPIDLIANAETPEDATEQVVVDPTPPPRPDPISEE